MRPRIGLVNVEPFDRGELWILFESLDHRQGRILVGGLALERAFAVVVTLAASASFITPLEPSCVLVYPAGHYRFGDFVKVGFPLTLVVMFIVLTLVPLVWPL